MIAEWLDPRRMDEASRKILGQEGLIFHATECIATAMQSKGVTKAELAAHLRRSRSFVTQLLDGTANMTLKTVADVFTVMDLELCVSYQAAVWVRESHSDNSLECQEGGIRATALSKVSFEETMTLAWDHSTYAAQPTTFLELAS